jgi:hypothetical protein
VGIFFSPTQGGVVIFFSPTQHEVVGIFFSPTQGEVVGFFLTHPRCGGVVLNHPPEVLVMVPSGDGRQLQSTKNNKPVHDMTLYECVTFLVLPDPCLWSRHTWHLPA